MASPVNQAGVSRKSSTPANLTPPNLNDSSVRNRPLSVPVQMGVPPQVSSQTVKIDKSVNDRIAAYANAIALPSTSLIPSNVPCAIKAIDVQESSDEIKSFDAEISIEGLSCNQNAKRVNSFAIESEIFKLKEYLDNIQEIARRHGYLNPYGLSASACEELEIEGFKFHREMLNAINEYMYGLALKEGNLKEECSLISDYSARKGFKALIKSLQNERMLIARSLSETSSHVNKMYRVDQIRDSYDSIKLRIEQFENEELSSDESDLIIQDLNTLKCKTWIFCNSEQLSEFGKSIRENIDLHLLKLNLMRLRTKDKSSENCKENLLKIMTFLSGDSDESQEKHALTVKNQFSLLPLMFRIEIIEKFGCNVSSVLNMVQDVYGNKFPLHSEFSDAYQQASLDDEAAQNRFQEQCENREGYVKLVREVLEKKLSKFPELLLKEPEKGLKAINQALESYPHYKPEFNSDSKSSSEIETPAKSELTNNPVLPEENFSPSEATDVSSRELRLIIETPAPIPVVEEIKPEPKQFVRFTVNFNAGNNKLFVRGTGPGMSWDQGVELKFADGHFIFEATEDAGDFEFKLLINNNRWESGENHKSIKGKFLSFSPNF